jgi:signal transduction histidine kinase
MEILGVAQTYRILASMTKPTGPYAHRVQTLCKLLVQLGFHSVRYYEAVHDRFKAEPTHFVLTQAAYHDGTESSVIGLQIPYSNTTLVTSSDGSDGLARGRFDNATDSQKTNWIERLKINKTNWIDLEVKSKGKVVGLLAMSWTGSRELIDHEDEAALRIIRGTLGNLYTASLGNDQPFVEGRQRLNQAINTWSANKQKSTSELSKSIGNLIGADLVSVFQYNWVTNSVTKVGEQAFNIQTKFDTLEESYDLGQMLTGRAFVDKDYRFIPDLPELIRNGDVNIDAKSLNYHNANIGALRSVIYFSIGSQSNRLLVRLFRSEINNLPSFTQRDHSLAQIIEEFATQAFDGLELRRRSGAVRTAAIDGLRGFSDPDRLMGLLKDELSQLGARTFIFVHYSVSGHSTDFVTATNDIADARSFFGSSASLAWDAIRSIPVKSSIFDLGPKTLTKLGLNSLNEEIRKLDRDSIGVFCLSSAGLVTLVILPLRGAGPSGVQPLEGRLSPDEVEHVLSLVSVFAASLEARASHISAENADDLLANIGHELQTPITEIEQSAISSIEACHEVLDKIASQPGLQQLDFDSARRELEVEVRIVNKKADLLRHMMDIPRTMSEFFGGDSMPISYRQSDWNQLVDESWSLAYSWAHEMSDYYSELGRASYGAIVLEKNEALKSMACVLCEPLVKMALTNIFKNAIKFSLPRYQGKPMIIEALAIPQTGWNIIQVRNWGIGIEKHRFEEIFRKYYRIDRLDAKRDIAGRGLGLYLARAMVKAQGGSLFCESSDWTLDDPEKRKTLQGFQTTFELRIPTTNIPGNKKVRLQ